MKTETRNGLALVAIGAASVCTGGVVWLTTSHAGSALLCGLALCLALVSLYSLLAWMLGRPQPRWGDVWALGYLLP